MIVSSDVMHAEFMMPYLDRVSVSASVGHYSSRQEMVVQK